MKDDKKSEKMSTTRESNGDRVDVIRLGMEDTRVSAVGDPLLLTIDDVVATIVRLHRPASQTCYVTAT